MSKGFVNYALLDFELGLIRAKLDAKGQGKPCGKGFISARKECSEKGRKQLASDLKSGDEGAKKRVARGKELAKSRQELTRQVQADKGKKPRDVAPSKQQKGGASMKTTKTQRTVDDLLSAKRVLPAPSINFKHGEAGKEAGDYSYLGTINGSMRFVGKDNAYTIVSASDLKDMEKQGLAKVTGPMKEPKMSHDITLKNIPKAWVAPEDQGEYMHTGTKGQQMQFIGLKHNNSIMLDKGDVKEWQDNGWLSIEPKAK